MPRESLRKDLHLHLQEESQHRDNQKFLIKKKKTQWSREMKNSLEVFKGLSEQGEERISDLEDRTMETIKAEEQKEKD